MAGSEKRGRTAGDRVYEQTDRKQNARKDGWASDGKKGERFNRVDNLAYHSKALAGSSRSSGMGCSSMTRIQPLFLSLDVLFALRIESRVATTRCRLSWYIRVGYGLRLEAGAAVNG